MKILLLDDSPKHRKAGVKQLQELGHEVVALCEYVEACKLASEQPFEVALLDLLMPAEQLQLGPDARKEWLGREISVGFPMVLELSRLGIKKIAVATDTNHHSHPMSAIVDWFDGKVHSVNGAKVMIGHSPMQSDGTKDWGKLLASLLAE
ncbi:MAG: response regulator [Chlamydiae bacterium]|nr:response regulator [Chlamydiota bacterium]